MMNVHPSNCVLMTGVVLGLLASSARAGDPVVFDQLSHNDGGVASDGAQGQVADVRFADDFLLNAPAVVTGIRWVGHSTNGDSPGIGNVSAFLVELRREDGNGEIAADVLFSAVVPVAASDTTALGADAINGATTFAHRHRFGPIALDPGFYYVTVGAINTNPDGDSWLWNRSTQIFNFTAFFEAPPLDIFPFQPWFQPVDLAFAITGPDVADVCEDRAPLFDGTTPFDTTALGTDGPVIGADACPAFGGDAQIHHDAWYTYIPPCDGQLTISTCGPASFDTRLAVYETFCPIGDGSLVACSDDEAGCPNGGSRVTLGVQSGTVYVVRVGGATAKDSGAGTMEVELVPDDGASVLQLQLPPTPVGGFFAGQTIDATVSMTNLCGPVSGFLASLQFDPGLVEFKSGTYTDDPFRLQVPVDFRLGGVVDLAASINPALGQTPSADDALLAQVSFTALADFCVPPIGFRDQDPPSRLIDPIGNPLPGQMLEVLPARPTAIGDINADGVVNVDDLLVVILAWGPCSLPPTPCPADVDCNGSVGVDDLVAVILNWG
ncbi:MAG: cohesin domain-containing protein [Planctomycetota bacterium]|jgi:hypothetical protein